MPPTMEPLFDFLLASRAEMAAFFCCTFFCTAAFSWASLLVVSSFLPRLAVAPVGACKGCRGLDCALRSSCCKGFLPFSRIADGP